MPPKNRFTKDEMIDAALDIVREKGIDALTARSLGARMGSSTRPMFTYFSTVSELKEAVRVRAAERYRACFGSRMSQVQILSFRPFPEA